MSMVFQEPMTALDPTMRVGRQIGEAVLLHRPEADRSDEVTRALSSVGLAEYPGIAQAYPHQLSGGQRQRVVLAMAMINSPELIICDEPTTALDVIVQAEVMATLERQLRETSAGCLFVSHNIALLAGICDEVAVMNDGEVVEHGRLKQVLADPQHPYTQGLIASADISLATPGARLPTVADYVDANVDSPKQSSTTEPNLTQLKPSLQRRLFEVTGLSKTYRNGSREVLAVDGVSLELNAGERLGLVGESGSGKSTVIKLLAGLVEPSAGSIRFAGREISGLPERRRGELRSAVQLVFQDPRSSLNPRMRVADLVCEPLRSPILRRRSDVPADHRARLAEVLAAVGLEQSIARRYPHELSGGQRQRVAIARALAPNPSVLIADEPVSALDVSVRSQVLNVLTELVISQNLALLMISHDLAAVRHLCPRMAVMRAGQIVEQGDTEQIYAAPQHPYTQQLLAAVPRLVRGLDW